MKSIYPTCVNTFRQWCQSRKNYYNFYISLGEPTLFDVTLRDGLQALSTHEQNAITTFDKMKMYNDIVIKYSPKNVEIGSVVSYKIFPIFSDTLPFLDLINNYYDDRDKTNKYILIPNKEKLRPLINNKYVNYFSFITSTSNSFQLKNTKKTLTESDDELVEILYELENKMEKTIVKIYVSCINECPIEGKIDNDYIVQRLLKLHNMNIDLICISDTCGSLDPADFEYIIDKCNILGLPMSKVSLHLHVNPKRISIVEQIIWKALDRKIVNFDVSNLKSGGCSVTIDRDKLAPNLSYEQYYQALCKYIIKKTD